MTVRPFVPWACLVACVLGAHAGPLPEGSAPIGYRIDVRLDPDSREFEGRETITWRNRGNVPVRRVPLHFYLNAFAHRGTTFFRETPDAGFGRFADTTFFKVHRDPWGWSEPSSIRRGGPDGAELSWRAIAPDDGNPLDRTVIEVELDRPLAAGETLVLSIDFAGRLPAPWARTGCFHGFCLVGQWYPKVGVRELPGTRGAARPRWNVHQFHASTEFYADFADYDVTIDVPADQLVAATGVERPVDGPPAEKGRERHRFVQRRVHDFAFVAGRGLAERTVEHVPPGRTEPVTLRVVLPADLAHQAPLTLDSAATALDVLGEAVGVYPYDTLTIVAPPSFAQRTSGMEYPTFITGGVADPALDWPPRSSLPFFVEMTVMHETAHQYFYGLLGSNEREEGYLDEGFTTYWQGRIFERWLETHPEQKTLWGRALNARDFGELMLDFAADDLREPLVRRPTWLYESGTHGVQIYGRTAAILETAERRFGRDTLDRVFAAYFERNAFRHPGVADFLEAARAAGSEELWQMLVEEMTARRLPLFRVEEVSVERFEVPEGHLDPAPAGPREAAGRLAGTTGGRVRLELTDPGHVRGLTIVPGGTRELALLPQGGAGSLPPVPGEDAPLWESRVVVTGPGRDHEPVTVELRFDDGVVLRHRWDGRSLWRRYRAVRPARLVDARIDPGKVLVLDPQPVDDGRRATADRRFARDWGLFLAGAAEWVAASLGGWL